MKGPPTFTFLVGLWSLKSRILRKTNPLFVSSLSIHAKFPNKLGQFKYSNSNKKLLIQAFHSELNSKQLLLYDLFYQFAAVSHISAIIEKLKYSNNSNNGAMFIGFAYKVTKNVMALHDPNSMCIVKMILPRISFSPS